MRSVGFAVVVVATTALSAFVWAEEPCIRSVTDLDGGRIPYTVTSGSGVDWRCDSELPADGGELAARRKARAQLDADWKASRQRGDAANTVCRAACVGPKGGGAGSGSNGSTADCKCLGTAISVADCTEFCTAYAMAFVSVSGSPIGNVCQCKKAGL